MRTASVVPNLRSVLALFSGQLNPLCLELLDQARSPTCVLIAESPVLCIRTLLDRARVLPLAMIAESIEPY